ncbi:RICIN domain-containing protein [Streptomyces sp. ISL-43]|uniref:RICIN domain-containing protein n=1 Tax=Streptomyces sp. ISL-43 TaxID=2819183 RepID=UPI001BE8E980|nr:RICIN domain-containing protein [Streptomyces sp. ISL-43]MBT2450744.1 RICIN domain-containing protein [Streptomyces sp. ISL-43]
MNPGHRPSGHVPAADGPGRLPARVGVDHWWTFESWTYEGRPVVRVVSKNLSVNGRYQCLAVPGASKQPGVQANQFECGPWKDHFRKLVDRSGRGDYRLVNLNSGQCLGVDGNSHSAGAKVIQWPCKPDGGDWPDHILHMTLD